MYHWTDENWPHFIWNDSLYELAEKKFLSIAGLGQGAIDLIQSENKKESILNILVKEALKTSAIEGEMVSRIDLVSSIKKKLGYNINIKNVKDKRSEGIAKAIVQSREDFDAELTETMMHQWHEDIFLYTKTITKGQWRTGTEPMQIVSGSHGREVVHYEAPPSKQVPREMKRYIQWFNRTRTNPKHKISNPIVRSALAHLYFESIHPYEDGNGRIGRILAEKALSQGLGHAALLSLSSSIDADKKLYYSQLKKAQQTLKIDAWIAYFSQIVIAAQLDFNETVQFVVKKSRFFEAIQNIVDKKQLKAIQKMVIDNQEFIGGMNASKYMSINKVSKATATRDLADLVSKNILISKGKGRSTNYQVNLDMNSA